MVNEERNPVVIKASYKIVNALKNLTPAEAIAELERIKFAIFQGKLAALE